MKKLLFIPVFILATIVVSGQTTFRALARTEVNNRPVTPVKVEGDGSMFNFTHNLSANGNCFSINFGNIELDKCDKFVFIYAGTYRGNVNCPLYYIKRPDGKYLSFQTGGAGFVDLITTPEVRMQKWLIAVPYGLPNGKYNLILPLAPVEFGYTLRLRDGKMEFGMGLKHRSSEADFYLQATPTKQAAGQPNTN